MSRLMKLRPVRPESAAVMAGFVAQIPGTNAEALLARVRALASVASKRFEVQQLVVLPVGSDRYAIGVLQSAVPRAFATMAKLFPDLTLAKQWNFDGHSSSAIFEEARTLDPLVVRQALQGEGVLLEPVDALGAGLFPAETDAADGLLVGSAALVYGCLLPSEGSTYEEGRVRTYRSSFDDNVVRVVGVELARAARHTVVRLGAAVPFEWEEAAREEVRAVLERPCSYWLVSLEV